MPRPARGYLGCHWEPLEEMPSGGLCTRARRAASEQDAHIDTELDTFNSCLLSQPPRPVLLYYLFIEIKFCYFFLPILPSSPHTPSLSCLLSAIFCEPCMFVCPCSHRKTRGGWTSRALSSLLPIRQGLTEFELTQQAPVIPIFIPPRCWNYKCIGSHLACF